jgi:2,6-dihydroxypseudooxynicotine hydrolase
VTGTQTQDERTYVAPTYLLTSIPDFVDSITYRMLADGMILQDVRAAREVEGWDAWPSFWRATAERHEAAGEEALALGSRLSAGEHFVRGSLSAHYGQFLSFVSEDVKREMVDLKARLFSRGAPLIRYPAERIEVPYRDGLTLPGYLRLPSGEGPHPVVVHVNGLDAAKEDAYQFATLCLDRGLAVFVWDGPGQGEMFFRGTVLDGTYHEAVSAVIDLLGTRPELDHGRVGIIGRSTGGFLAPRAAATDSRITACVAWGAMYDLAEWDAMPPLIKDGFQYVTRTRDWSEAQEAMRFVDLRGYAERITCPLYVLHGGKDNITPPYNAHRMIEEAAGPTTLALYPDSIHCNHDVAHIARPAMADWLAAQLRAPGAGPAAGTRAATT